MNTIYSLQTKTNPQEYQIPKDRGYMFPTAKNPVAQKNKLSFKSYLGSYYNVDPRIPDEGKSIVDVVTETILITFFNGKGLPQKEDIKRQNQILKNIQQELQNQQTSGQQLNQIF